MEKFKFVLDYKIKELKRQIEPRENAITGMRQRIKTMDEELEAFHTSNAAMDEMIGECRRARDAMQRDISSHRCKIRGSGLAWGVESGEWGGGWG